MRFLLIFISLLLFSCSAIKEHREKKRHEKWVRKGLEEGWMDTSKKQIQDTIYINQDSSRSRVKRQVVTIITEANQGSPCDSNGKIKPEVIENIANNTTDFIKENFALVEVNKPFVFKDKISTVTVVVDKNGRVSRNIIYDIPSYKPCKEKTWEDYWYLIIIGALSMLLFVLSVAALLYRLFGRK